MRKFDIYKPLTGYTAKVEDNFLIFSKIPPEPRVIDLRDKVKLALIKFYDTNR
jgi:hypothetical protein